jgi:signal transduction histidine kinase/DNA-binding response OmpR family regulator
MLQSARGPVVFASSPILKSDGSGPIAGRIIYAKLLDERQIEAYREKSRVAFTLTQVGEDPLSSLDRSAYDEIIAIDAGTVRRENDGSVLLYRVVSDIHGAPAFLLRAETPHDIALLGTNALNGALVFLLMTGLFLIAAIWIFFSEIIIAPIAVMRAHILEIRHSGELGSRLNMKRTDELGDLADEFDEMTEKLDQAQLEMARARDAALEVARLKSEFLATMSHEIRTPMNGVVGMTELLIGTALNSQQKRFAEGIQHSADGLLSVINDVLDLSKLEAGRVELERRAFDLRTVVEEVAFLFAAPAQAKGLEIACKIPPDLHTACRGDSHRLRQILVNLVGNAIKFTRQGEVVICVSDLGRSDDGDLMQFEVSDTGIGISAEDQRQIFNSFTQADASTTRQFGGTGLGLAISRQLVDLMGGEMSLESEPGVGSKFSFSVRFEYAKLAALMDTEAPESVRGVRVLVVDDNATNREILYHQLSVWEMHCVTVESAGDALIALRDAASLGAPFGLAILDLHMPEMDGLELARAIRANPETADVPLVMLSSVLLAGDSQARADAGIQAHLVKPVRQAELYDVLTRVMGGAEASEASAMEPSAAAPERQIEARILLVEDNVVNQQVAAAMLEGIGCEVEIANNGELAVSALEQASFDLILMDCQMPVMDGYEATAEIRRREAASEPSRRIPIVALTANAVDGDREKCLEADMDDYVSKPFKQARLREVLGHWLGGAEDVEAPAAPDAQAEAQTEPTGESSPEDSVIDWSVIESLRELEVTGRPHLVSDVIRVYLSSSCDLMEDLQEAVDAEDAPAIRQGAHTLKSSSRNLGAGSLAAMCEQMEGMGRESDFSNAKSIIQLIATEHRRVVTALQS